MWHLKLIQWPDFYWRVGRLLCDICAKHEQYQTTVLTSSTSNPQDIFCISMNALPVESFQFEDAIAGNVRFCTAAGSSQQTASWCPSDESINRNVWVKLNSKPQRAGVQQKRARPVERDHESVLVWGSARRSWIGPFSAFFAEPVEPTRLRLMIRYFLMKSDSQFTSAWSLKRNSQTFKHGSSAVKSVRLKPLVFKLGQELEMRNFLFGLLFGFHAAWKGTEPAVLSNVSVTPWTLCAEV